jgi:gluconate:H+ symporter, GntP family
MHPLLILAIAVAVVLVMILRLRINAFLALITAAMAVGLLSAKIPLAEVMPKVAGSFGEVAGKIAIVIALAAIIGECLLESGAADKITRVFVRLAGERRAHYSLMGSGYILAIPVFFDTVFYLLIPLARSMGIRTGAHYLLFVMAICAGGVSAHCLVPPTPGPLAMAAVLGVDLGVMILVGLAVALPASIAGMAFAVYVDRKLNLPMRETPGVSLDELKKIAMETEERLPGFAISILPIFLPVLLITSNTLMNAVAPQSAAAQATAFFGNANFALFASAAVAISLIAHHRKYSLADLGKFMERALLSAGLIILITSAGGAFGAMLVEAQVGAALSAVAMKISMPILFLGFLLGAVFKLAQGSSTVAMITVASIMAPMMAGGAAFHPAYMACAIGSGSLVGAWMNDSGFWIYKQMSGFTEAESVKTWTILLAIMGVTGYVAAQIGALVLPLV